MSKAKKHEFKAEIQQLLDIVINSLYTDKEIFIRELVSNAADALEKLRFQQASGATVHDPDLELAVSITTDEKEQTISIADTGIGMTADELVENLGTIAHSGSKAFVQQLAEAKEKGDQPDANLIGQFGVGFYSAFMVGDKVTVETRSFDPEAQGCRWVSEGAGSYEIESVKGDLPRGTKITVQLKKDQKTFAEAATVKGIVKRYSSFVPFPINVNGEHENTVEAIWARDARGIKADEYEEFYKLIGHDSDGPMYRLHFSADAPLAIRSLLFVPKRNFEMPGMPRAETQVHLYCRKVLIDPEPKELLPEWMRFVKGVVDSEDLPLNISRESMQDSALMAKLKKVLSKRFIKMLTEKAKKDAEEYDGFFAQFGRFIKEGVASDFDNKEALGKLLRFESSVTDAGKTTSLADYVSRMPEEQTEIYYITAPNREAAEASPYFEAFKVKSQEVLFFYDAWDEFVADHLMEFDGKKLVAAEKAEVEVDAPAKDGERLNDEDGEALAKWIKEKLGDDVNEVRISKRLVDSPAVIVDGDKFMTASMRRMMKSMNPDGGGLPEKYDLEINPGHNMIVLLNQQRADNSDLAGKVAEQIYDNCRAAAGLLEDPRAMINRMNELLEQALGGGRGRD